MNRMIIIIDRSITYIPENVAWHIWIDRGSSHGTIRTIIGKGDTINLRLFEGRPDVCDRIVKFIMEFIINNGSNGRIVISSEDITEQIAAENISKNPEKLGPSDKTGVQTVFL